jgi:pimeloyl-ACP methyl ester carboxylesterase
MADVHVRGLRFHVQRLASQAPAPRPTVVFLHGLVMDNLSSWYFAAATQTTRVADVVLYDLRGHGKSERPASGYGLEDQVADLLGVLDGVGATDPVYLVGNSFGGLLALAFAIRHPSRVAGLVLVEGHFGDDTFAIEMAATLQLEGEERDRRIAESFKEWMGRHSQRKTNRLADGATALVSGTTLVADMGATQSLTRAELATIRCPVLGIYGENSDLRFRAERTLAAVPHAELVVLGHCTHSVLWEATAEVRERIVSFVGGLAAAPAATVARQRAVGDSHK